MSTRGRGYRVLGASYRLCKPLPRTGMVTLSGAFYNIGIEDFSVEVTAVMTYQRGGPADR